MTLPRVKYPSLVGAFVSSACRFLRGHRPALFCCLAVCLLLAVWRAAQMTPDMSIRAFFPEGGQARRLSEGLALSPAARFLFIELRADGEGREESLVSAADAIAKDIPAGLAESLSFAPPRPSALLSLLPLYADEKTMAFLRASGTPDAVARSLEGIRAAAAGLVTAGPALAWMRADPLAWRRIILDRMPDTGGMLTPDPVLGWPVSPDGRRLLIVLRPAFPLQDVEKAEELTKAVASSLARHLPGGVSASVLGGHAQSAENARVIRGDIGRIVVFSTAGFLAVYLALVRSFGLVWLWLVPFCASALALGLMGSLFPTLSGLALAFGASVLGVAEDYAVHTHFALRSNRPEDSVLGVMTGPLLAGFFVNVSGFAALGLSGMPVVRQLACFAAMTMGFGVLLALFVLPQCPGFAGPAIRGRGARAPKRRPVWGRTLLCTAFLLALCAALASAMRFDASPRRMGAGAQEMQEAMRDLSAAWGLRERTMLLVRGATAGEALAGVRRLAARMPGASLAGLVPDAEKARENVLRWNAFVREEGEGLTRTLEAAGREQGFSADAFAAFRGLLRPATPPEGTDAIVGYLRAAGLANLVDACLSAPAGSAKDWTAALFAQEGAKLPEDPGDPAARATLFSPGSLEAALREQFARECRLVPVAWALCFFVILAYHRRFLPTLVASLPPLCSLACILLVMLFSGGALTLAHLAAMPLVLGLAADHGISVVHDMRCGLRLGIRRSILVSSLTTLTGMGLLALARHPVLHDMGQVIFWGLLAEGPASLLLLPLLWRREGSDGEDA